MDLSSAPGPRWPLDVVCSRVSGAGFLGGIPPPPQARPGLPDFRPHRGCARVDALVAIRLKWLSFRVAFSLKARQSCHHRRIAKPLGFLWLLAPSRTYGIPLLAAYGCGYLAAASDRCHGRRWRCRHAGACCYAGPVNLVHDGHDRRN